MSVWLSSIQYPSSRLWRLEWSILCLVSRFLLHNSQGTWSTQILLERLQSPFASVVFKPQLKIKLDHNLGQSYRDFSCCFSAELKAVMGNVSESRKGIKLLSRKLFSSHSRGQKWGRHGEAFNTPTKHPDVPQPAETAVEGAPLETLLGLLLLQRGTGNVLTLWWAGLRAPCLV